jgi:hypothetical protein
MPPEKKEKTYWATRQAIGGLYKAASSSTDPAHTLEFFCSLINATRAALIRKLEDKVPNSDLLPGIFNTLLKIIATKWNHDGIIPGEYLDELNQRIDTVFKEESMARYGLEIYRDILFCDDLLMRWGQANDIYISNKNAWSMSNKLIAPIQMQLFEIIDRHDLKEFPKGESFNIDSSDMAAMAISKMLSKGAGTEP